MYRSYGALPCPFQRFPKNHPCCSAGTGDHFQRPCGPLGSWTPRRAVPRWSGQSPPKFPKICEIWDGSRPAGLQHRCVSMMSPERVPCRSPISSISINTYNTRHSSFGISITMRRLRVGPQRIPIPATAFDAPSHLGSAIYRDRTLPTSDVCQRRMLGTSSNGPTRRARCCRATLTIVSLV